MVNYKLTSEYECMSYVGCVKNKRKVMDASGSDKMKVSLSKLMIKT